MPNTDARELRILRERARRLAQVQGGAARRRAGREFVVVAVGGERLAIEASEMAAVVPTPPIASLPALPVWMAGIVRVRGLVLTAISLARWFEIIDGGDEGFMAIVENHRGALGLLVDGVLGFRSIDADDLAAGLATSGSAARPIHGVTTDLLTVLDIDAVLANAELSPGGRA